MRAQKIAIGSDHAGYSLKERIKKMLGSRGIELLDEGSFSEERADYPDYAHKVSRDILGGMADLGILICGSGNGIAMTANKHRGIRCALCWNAEVAALSRLHNDANILALPARFISEEEAIKCVDAFLSTRFEGGRHVERVRKIDC